MINTRKSKKECYEFLGGKENSRTTCFLCDEFKDDENHCPQYLSWTQENNYENNPCLHISSPFRTYWDSECIENAKQVLEYLKSEYERLFNNHRNNQ